MPFLIKTHFFQPYFLLYLLNTYKWSIFIHSNQVCQSIIELIFQFEKVKFTCLCYYLVFSSPHSLMGYLSVTLSFVLLNWKFIHNWISVVIACKIVAIFLWNVVLWHRVSYLQSKKFKWFMAGTWVGQNNLVWRSQWLAVVLVLLSLWY